MKCFQLLLLAVAVLANAKLCGNAVGQESRVWTDVTGRTVVAEYLGIEGQGSESKVHVRRSDGKEFRFPVARLSESDRAYLQKKHAQLRNPVTEMPKDALQPFLQKYCVRCHGAKQQNGQVRFDTLQWQVATNEQAQRWQDVLDQLNGGDMPPEDEPQPPNKQLADVLDRLTQSLLAARRRLTDHGGEIRMRRLNRREYSATIRDLFGFDVALEDIPADGEIASFDTVGAEQFFTSAHFERYLELGKKIARESFQFNLGARRKVKTVRTEPEKRVTERMRENLADLDRKMEMKKAGASWQEMGFKDEGEMEVIFRQWVPRAEVPRRYLQYPLVEQGVYICDVAKWTSASMHTDIRGEYIVRIHGGVHGNPDELRRLIRVRGRQRVHGTLRLNGTTEKPQSVEIRVRQPMGRFQLSANIRENVPDNTINSMVGYLNKLQGPAERADPRAAVWIDWIEIEGPYYPDERPKFEEILFPGKATGKGSPYIWNDAKIPELIEKFVREAFRRRPPEPEYLAGLNAIFREHRAAGMNHRDAMIEVMGIVLASPGFLFLHEPVVAETGSSTEALSNQDRGGQLGNRELAVRLAYFLWSSPPDDELYSADLSDPIACAKQVDRMLADPRIVRLRDGFISQWAEFEKYDAITIDNRKHFRFNEGVKEDAKREVREFFGTLIEENLPASNLIDSDFVTINAALAAHYGIRFPSTPSDAFRKVALPPDSPRGGLMTQAAFLVAGSNGERSSPVIRGALIMEKLLHDRPAPPPPNVPELDEASSTPRSNREMVELHQQRAVCASCHRKMDVIGFGLENFDTTGQWRDTEQVGRKQVPIEPGGVLPDGKAFADVQELKKVLLSQEDALAGELLESMLGYGLGRTIEFSDADDVAALRIKLKTEKYRIRSMIREIALSPLFRKP